MLWLGVNKMKKLLLFLRRAHSPDRLLDSNPQPTDHEARVLTNAMFGGR